MYGRYHIEHRLFQLYWINVSELRRRAVKRSQLATVNLRSGQLAGCSHREPTPANVSGRITLLKRNSPNPIGQGYLTPIHTSTEGNYQQHHF